MKNKKMKKITLFLIITFLSFEGFSQTNQMAINYQLLKANNASQVGGDLIIDNNNTSTICANKDANLQVLFNSLNASTISIDVNNRGGGDSCVTLVIETLEGTIKKEIPADTQSGVLKFSRVKKAFLTIQKRVNNNPNDIAKSIGTATIWF